tara:strand:- start:58 stop:2436 length:2379 start_codon:yes stop_codon:yes gene_type:complete
MDLTQQKLVKSEWEFLEVPVDAKEKNILNIIYNAYGNTSYSQNDSMSLLGFMKIGSDDDSFHFYLYEQYFQKVCKKIIKKFDLSIKIKKQSKKKKTIKKADIIRINSLSKKIDDVRDLIFEFILIQNIFQFFDDDFNSKNYYSLTQLMKNKIAYTNKYILYFVNEVLVNYKSEVSKKKLIKNALTHIEKNVDLFKFADMKLYSHQADLFEATYRDGAKLILYQAPTGTGKTMSPVGLSKGNKIIFTCAAKHIGLQLAKALISMEIPIAIAFGCVDSGDIRLHYFAAKDYVKNRRTGGIFRVDNSNGEKVQVIITDIQSYLPAMNYMLAFNEASDIIWYWDEPTITLDYENHPFHEILQKNWKKNEIPNVVLSSATLPNKEDIMPMTSYFNSKFKSNNVQEIISYECKKSIPILDAKGNIVMPHFLFKRFKKLKKCARHIEKNKTILRHIDVNEMIKFIIYVNKKKYVASQYLLENYFENFEDIEIISLKIYYLRLLSLVKENWDDIYKHFQEKDRKMYESVIKITTNDAYSLTEGPTIFLTQDVKKTAMFYLRVSNIPEAELDKILEIMEENEEYMLELEEVEKAEEQRKDKIGSETLAKDHSKNIKSDEYKIYQAYLKRVAYLKSKIQSIELSSKYIPNSEAHIREWSKDKATSKSFSSEIEDEIVEKIMYLNVDKEWKILLLMGIGVFVKHENKEYMDIMKKLAEEQKLYLIIASSDYIYGTNYQFCHGYLSKDLINMTQEKMIQAFGRVGRKGAQSDYTLRIRDDALIEKLYTKEENKPEVRNMNRLFT